MANSSEYIHVTKLLEVGEVDQAHRMLARMLNDDPNDAKALFLSGRIHTMADHHGLALNLYLRAQACSDGARPEIHAHMSMSYEGLGDTEKAREHALMANTLKPGYPNFLANLGLVELHDGNNRGAIEWCDKALAIDPDHEGATVTRGFGYLGLGRWSTGWPGFERALGGKYRTRIDLGLREWHGERSEKCVYIYGEQGIGDEVMFAAYIMEASKRAPIVLECDPRLYNLFKFSLSSSRVTVYGTRNADKLWFREADFSYQCPAGRLVSIFAPDVPREPHGQYLHADLSLRQMYLTLQRMHGGAARRVGVCWTGGSRVEDRRKRDMGIDAIGALAERYPECAFYSLEYNDPRPQIKASGLLIDHSHFVVGRGAGFDHLAAYLVNLDTIIGPPTAVHHLAGALGVRSIVLVNDKPNWVFGAYQGDQSCLYESVELFHQQPGEPWIDTMKRFMESQEL